MNRPTIAEVEAAVRTVLQARGGAGQDAVGDVFAGPVFGVRHAEALGAATREVRVTAGTVITPLAREVLKRGGIALRVVGRGEVVRGGEWGFAIEIGSGIAVALRRSLLANEQATWTEIGTDHRDAARWVAGSSGRSALALTNEASVATWEACQVEGVRAATVADADAAARAARHLGANLLVVELGGQSIASVRHILAAFRRTARPDGATGGIYEDR